MNIGLDYWHVCSDWPVFFSELASSFIENFNAIYIISAVGRKRAGTVEAEINKLNIPYHGVYEVIFKHPSESPKLKYRKCQELGIQVFFDDRQDVCDYMNARGMLAMKVPRLSKNGRLIDDIGAEIK